MPVVIEDAQTESLVRQIALAKGISDDDAVRESLTSLAGLRRLLLPKLMSGQLDVSGIALPEGPREYRGRIRPRAALGRARAPAR